jgi:penicillin amidase
VSRRGRIAELFGDRVLDVDIYMRTLEFEEVAEQEYNLLDEETRQFLDVYTTGVISA